ncbi:GerAB/ArcD/ProY family transporter [Cohnella algarum]|uniref:GerAB/ArcD/ProY family transporter n=1 Tax=Cohnella algarum TaxID=2044859 RepID=UPI0019682B79|nr:endospore germination permease [Cohnella algarum]MBN2982312.1 endospore germination permease [Cohnella algarum]
MSVTERISHNQLRAAVVVFLIGSTPLFELGIKQKTDAWLVAGLGFAFGYLLMLLFLAVQKFDPSCNLVELLKRNFGKIAGTAVSLLYVLYFAYEAMRNVRDIGDLTIMTLLDRTPLGVVMIVLVLLVAYAVYQGIEVVFRLAEILIWGILFFYLGLVIIMFLSGNAFFRHLLPLFDTGVAAVVVAALRDATPFPFGQIVVFLMFFSSAAYRPGWSRFVQAGFVIAGLVILSTNVINLAVLSAPVVQISAIPFLQTVQSFEVAYGVGRFDVFVVILLYVGIFMKATVWALAAVTALTAAVGLSRKKATALLSAAIYGSAFYAPSWPEHIRIGEIVALEYGMNPFFIGLIPFLLLITMLLKRLSSRRIR